jgi:hypothetical protein
MKVDRNKVQVWECKIIVPEGAELPPGFDAPPRSAAVAAVEAAGIEVLGCSSGWGGSLTKGEEEAFNSQVGDVYITGLVDEQEGSTH